LRKKGASGKADSREVRKFADRHGATWEGKNGYPSKKARMEGEKTTYMKERSFREETEGVKKKTLTMLPSGERWQSL